MPYRTSVPGPSEEAFRALLDERGTLRPAALASPDRDACFAVFSQDRDARLSFRSIRENAARFFGAKVGMTVDKAYGGALDVDAARFVIATDDKESSGTRLGFARPVGPDDLVAAEEAERRVGTYGLSALARRCPMLWLIVPETNDDRAALLLAAVFATVMLGPIVPPGGGDIFGVRTARLKLERGHAPYR